MADRPRVCVGVITGAHGVRGLVRLKSYTAEPTDLVAYGQLGDETGERRFAVTLQSMAKGQFIARVDGVDDRQAADALRGIGLYIDRDLLPETDAPDDFYYADLIGLRVETVDGALYGFVRSVDDYGAGDVIDIELAGGGGTVLPFTRTVFPSVDIERGLLVVALPHETEVRDTQQAPPGR